MGAPPSRPGPVGITAHPAPQGSGAILIGPPSPRPCSHAVPMRESSRPSRGRHRAPAFQQLRPFRRLLARWRPQGWFERLPFRVLPWRGRRPLGWIDQPVGWVDQPLRRFRRRFPRRGRVAQRQWSFRRYLRWRVPRCGRFPLRRYERRTVPGFVPIEPRRASGPQHEHLEPQWRAASRRRPGSARAARLEGRTRRGAPPDRRSSGGIEVDGSPGFGIVPRRNPGARRRRPTDERPEHRRHRARGIAPRRAP
jgi:hypothetical protein